jgi:hypothetical protein
MKNIIILTLFVSIYSIRQLRDYFLVNGQKLDTIGEEHPVISRDSLNFTNNDKNYFYSEDTDHIVY